MITKRALKRYIDKAIARAIKRYTDDFNWQEFARRFEERVAKPLLEMKHSSPDPEAKKGASEALYIANQLKDLLSSKRKSKKILTAFRGLFEVAKKYATNAKTVPRESQRLYGIGERAMHLMIDLQTQGVTFDPEGNEVAGARNAYLKEPKKKASEKIKEQAISIKGTQQGIREKLGALIRSGKIKRIGERFANPDGSIVVKLQEILDVLKGGPIGENVKALVAEYK